MKINYFAYIQLKLIFQIVQNLTKSTMMKSKKKLAACTQHISGNTPLFLPKCETKEVNLVSLKELEELSL
jgi:hypothetical protein